MKSQFQANCNASSNAKDQKVPRPLNCFMTYRLEKQREIVGRCPGANHRDISKIIAKWWKELSPEEKEPYRVKAEKARVEHRKMYPGYKFSPKKKLSKPRAYKKRPDNQFTARDHEDEQELYRLYHDGKDVSLPSVDGERFPLLLDAKEPKPSCASHKKIDSLGRDDYSKKYRLGYFESLSSSNETQLNASPYNTGLLYPPTTSGSLLYPQQLYSPSASPYTIAHSPSTSSYATGYYSSSEEPAQEVSYNLYSTQYRYEGAGPHAYYSSPAQYFSAPGGYYYNTSSPVYDSPKGSHIFAEESATVTPSLLTSAFYYQH